jgi:hypothetical protein
MVVGNWSIPGQLIDQLLTAVVVVNCPPFKGALTACRPHNGHSPLQFDRRGERRLTKPPAEAPLTLALIVTVFARMRGQGGTLAALPLAYHSA